MAATESTAAETEENQFPEGMIDDMSNRLSVPADNLQQGTWSAKDHRHVLSEYYGISEDLHKKVTKAERDIVGAACHVAANRLMENIATSETPKEEVFTAKMPTGSESLQVKAQACRKTTTPGTQEEHYNPAMTVTKRVSQAVCRDVTHGLPQAIQDAVDKKLAE